MSNIKNISSTKEREAEIQKEITGVIGKLKELNTKYGIGFAIAAESGLSSDSKYITLIQGPLRSTGLLVSVLQANLVKDIIANQGTIKE